MLEKTIRRGQREEAFALDVDPEDNAYLLFGSAHLIAQMKFTRQSPEKIERFLHTLVRIAIGGQLWDSVAARAKEPPCVTAAASAALSRN